MNFKNALKLMTLALVACGGSQDGNPVGTHQSAECQAQSCESPELDGRRFLLESSQGFQPVAGTKVALSFRGHDLSLNAGCNSHGGAFKLRDGRLTVDELASTEIGCDQERHEQDQWLATFLTQGPELKLDGDRLTLTGADAELIFLDREVADPDRPLAVTPWSVDTLLDGQSASSLPLPSDPTLLFREDGSLQIDTTCNTGMGSYAVSGNQLTLTNVAYTEKACSGASAVADAHLQNVLRDGQLTFEIEAARLTIERGDIGVAAIAPAR